MSPQFMVVGGLRTRLVRAGAGAAVLVLHGWGANIEAVHPIVSGLRDSVEVIAVDLPGFGETEGPPSPWGVADYAAWTLELLDSLELERVSLIGHSFGGRIAIWLAAHDPQRLARIVLVDSAGIRPRRGWQYYAKVGFAKLTKHLGPHLGPLGRRMQARVAARVASSDYANAGALRPTFVKVVNEDLTPLLARIAAPTLLIWGEDDTATPLADAQVMERLIPDAGLVIFAGAGHYSYLDDPRRFAVIVKHFLAG